MEVANIDVKSRPGVGRRKTQLLRAEGYIPGVVYGRGGESVSLSLPGQKFTSLVMTHHKLFELHVEGGAKEEAFLQDLQWDALTDRIQHVDFRRIDLNESIQTDVEIRYVGQPKGLAKSGVFEALVTRLQVECLPRDLPEELRIVVNNLDIDDSMQLRDLPLPSGVKALGDPEQLVCQCKLRAVVEDDEAEGDEAEGTAEPEVIGKKEEADE